MIEAEGKCEHGGQKAGEEQTGAEAEIDLAIIGVAGEFEPLPCSSDNAFYDWGRKRKRSQEDGEGGNV